MIAYLSPIKKDGSTESGYRIAGPKGWGGTVAIASLYISEGDLKRYVNEYTTSKSEHAEAALTHRDEQVKGLVEALEWYQEQTRLARLIHSEGDEGRDALAKDGGDRARAAIAAYKEQTK